MSFEDVTYQFTTKFLEFFRPEVERNGKREIPTDFILKRTINTGNLDDPMQLFNFKHRNVSANADAQHIELNSYLENTRVFKYIDYPNVAYGIIRYYVIYITPQLRHNIQELNNNEIPINIFFHPTPVPKDDGSPREYGKGAVIDDYFKDLAIRYCMGEHKLIFQHRSAVKHDDHLATNLSIPSCLVLPLFSKSAYDEFSNVQRGKGNVPFFDIIDDLIRVAVSQMTGINRNYKRSFTSLSAFSFGANLIFRLFQFKRWLDKFDTLFMFDPVFTGRPNGISDGEWKILYTKVVKHFFELFKKWKSDRSIYSSYSQYRSYKLYTASEQHTGFYEDEKNSIMKEYGTGKTFVALSQFNGRSRPTFITNPPCDCDEKKYKNLSNAFELSSYDKTRYIFHLAKNNFTLYDATVKNCCGMRFGSGHAWFMQNLLSHALYNSGF